MALWLFRRQAAIDWAERLAKCHQFSHEIITKAHGLPISQSGPDVGMERRKHVNILRIRYEETIRMWCHVLHSTSFFVYTFKKNPVYIKQLRHLAIRCCETTCIKRKTMKNSGYTAVLWQLFIFEGLRRPPILSKSSKAKSKSRKVTKHMQEKEYVGENNGATRKRQFTL